jgi:hypothetical protein
MKTSWRSFVVVALAGCQSQATEDSAASSAKGTAATSAASTSVTAASSASPPVTASATVAASVSAPPPEPCKERGLKGTGTFEDMCVYEEERLTASIEGAPGDNGVTVKVSNPTPDTVRFVTFAVYYYDAATKQVPFQWNGKETWALLTEKKEVVMPKGLASSFDVGPKKEDLPAEVTTVEVRIVSFGVDVGGEGIAWLKSATPYSRYRGIRGGLGPTGIAECDTYFDTLELCPGSFPDAYKAARKSKVGYNNAAPETQTKLADGMRKGCESGLKMIAGKCGPY